MLKPALLAIRKKPTEKQVVIVRQNPELLEGAVVDNHSPWDQGSKNGNGSGEVRLMNRNQLKAVCSERASHPMTSNTFQRRKPTTQEAPLNNSSSVEDPYIGFTLQALGR